MADFPENANEIMNAVIEYVCYAYRVDYNELADMLGMNRGWFTRYRNARFGDKGYQTTMKLIELAVNVDGKQLISALFDE